MEETKNEGSLGPIVGIILILLVIILGGLYFWGERVKKANTLSDDAAQSMQDNQNIESITTQSSSDATADIEADLNATDIDSLDSNL
jgi:hypothetical protein